MSAFAPLGLSPALCATLTKLKHDTPTPVQTAAIPAILQGRDVRASAQTGSGKTAAFVLPLLHHERLHGGIGALVMAPTRELAMQIAEAIETYGDHPKVCLVIGGASTSAQMLDLRGGADFVVATPGRLIDLAKRNAIDLSKVRALVLDEADRLLSLGFSEALNEVMDRLPALTQTLLFSATLPKKVLALADQVLRNPVCINIDAGGLAKDNSIEQRAIEVDERMRARLLVHLIKTYGWVQILVFVASRKGADDLVKRLRTADIYAGALHGELSQSERTQALDAFKHTRLQVLVATDLAARGLDIAQLSAVVNYDLPRSPTDYVHRIGRTGRAGEPGDALSFVTAANAAHFALIEKHHGLRLARERIEGFLPTDPAVSPHASAGGIKGKRKSKKDRLREAALK